MRILVDLQLKEVTLMSCSGFEARIRLALGKRTLVEGQLTEVTFMFSSGLEARIRLAIGTQSGAQHWRRWTLTVTQWIAEN